MDRSVLSAISKIHLPLDKVQYWTYTAKSPILDFNFWFTTTAIHTKGIFMDRKIKELNAELNQIAKRLDEQYHLYASRHGLSDPAFWVLYTIYESDSQYTQNELAEMWCYPKQTVNFAISGLVKKGYLILEPIAATRHSKAVRLTKEGEMICKAVIAPLIEAEQRSLARMTEEERALSLSLSENHCRIFQEEVGNLLHSQVDSWRKEPK